jgi:hypothetical protein
MGMENISARESRYVAVMMDAPAIPKGKEFARSTVQSPSSPPRAKKWNCSLRHRIVAEVLRSQPAEVSKHTAAVAVAGGGMEIEVHYPSDDEEMGAWIWKSSCMARLGAANGVEGTTSP